MDLHDDDFVFRMIEMIEFEREGILPFFEN
jgi:hypothetical protein